MKINEIFYSIQGEGKSIGKTAVFVRLSGCSLSCNFCDSKYHTKIDQSLTTQNILNTLSEKNCKRIVFTGGEPLLQQKAIYDFIRENKSIFLSTSIEIETNGTIEFSKEFTQIINDHCFKFHFNVSPKLSSSGNPKTKTYYKQFKDIKGNNASIFKFVYVKNYFYEILDYVSTKLIPKKMVYIMPEGATKKEQENLMEEVVAFCKIYDFTFSPRLHVLIWDNQRGI